MGDIRARLGVCRAVSVLQAGRRSERAWSGHAEMEPFERYVRAAEERGCGVHF